GHGVRGAVGLLKRRLGGPAHVPVRVAHRVPLVRLAPRRDGPVRRLHRLFVQPVGRLRLDDLCADVLFHGSSSFPGVVPLSLVGFSFSTVRRHSSSSSPPKKPRITPSSAAGSCPVLDRIRSAYQQARVPQTTQWI